MNGTLNHPYSNPVLCWDGLALGRSHIIQRSDADGIGNNCCHIFVSQARQDTIGVFANRTMGCFTIVSLAASIRVCWHFGKLILSMIFPRATEMLNIIRSTNGIAYTASHAYSDTGTGCMRTLNKRLSPRREWMPMTASLYTDTRDTCFRRNIPLHSFRTWYSVIAVG